MNVVRFVSLVEANNLTVEGWMDGEGYFCEYDKDSKHEIKTYREYFHFHDLEAIFKSHSLFSEVKVGSSLIILIKHHFKGDRYRPNCYGDDSDYLYHHHLQKTVLYFLLVDETAKKIQEL